MSNLNLLAMGCRAVVCGLIGYMAVTTIRSANNILKNGTELVTNQWLTDIAKELNAVSEDGVVDVPGVWTAVPFDTRWRTKGLFLRSPLCYTTDFTKYAGKVVFTKDEYNKAYYVVLPDANGETHKVFKLAATDHWFGVSVGRGKISAEDVLTAIKAYVNAN